jgi:hypothetical protein
LKQYQSGRAKVEKMAQVGSDEAHYYAEIKRLSKEKDVIWERTGRAKGGRATHEDLARLKQIDQETTEASQKHAEAAAQRRTIFKELAKVETPVFIDYQIATEGSDWEKDGVKKSKSIRSIREAAGFLDGIVQNRGNDVFQCDVRPVPARENNRAYYRDSASTSYLRRTDEEQAHVAVHEWAHHLEYRMKGAQQACQDFLKYRTKGEKPTKMNDAFNTDKYGDDEVGCKDEFDKAFGPKRAYYVGKIYNGPTEILSMGVQQLYEDPVAFAQKDPEYCQFVMGILDGSLRGPV